VDFGLWIYNSPADFGRRVFLSSGNVPITMSVRPQILGILNLTPDSFSDGGAYASVDAAVDHARRMIDQGADGIDVGGESTRPGAQRIPAQEQIRRIIPVIQKLAGGAAMISVDTTLSAVAKAALDAGAKMINDVSAGREDEAMFELAASRDARLILMHMLGEPATMQNDPQYDDVVTEVGEFLVRRAHAAMAAGIKRQRIILDPGIGFGKTTEHNLQLLGRLDVLVATGFEILLGTSRKRFLGEICGIQDAADRDMATAATTALGVSAGVRYFRVHAVKPNRHAADIAFRMANCGL
jgi:dihydropteroate synthase